MGTFNLYEHDLFGNPVTPQGCKLADDFIVPPFSVLSARDGDWQDRKRRWISLGIKSEIGRGEGSLDNNRDPGRCFGQDLMRGEHVVGQKGGLTCPGKAAEFDGYRVKEGTRESTDVSGTSIFDPVICELSYRWYMPTGGQVVDPFAGGSVRGIVASLLGYRYWGCDLRQEQIEANRQQARDICPDAPPEWVCADAMETLETAPEADFVFSCPPYGDLERYSDDPRDLSTMEYHTFIGAYRRIIMRACARLKSNRFASFVVGDFRDPKTGHYRNFISDTIESFRQCGLGLYNEQILITCVGSLPIRVGKQFTAGRKLGKTHQNILTFIKGDWRQAAQVAGPLRPEYALL